MTDMHCTDSGQLASDPDSRAAGVGCHYSEAEDARTVDQTSRCAGSQSEDAPPLNSPTLPASPSRHPKATAADSRSSGGIVAERVKRLSQRESTEKTSSVETGRMSSSSSSSLSRCSRTSSIDSAHSSE